jgi:hypothetical protein
MTASSPATAAGPVWDRVGSPRARRVWDEILRPLAAETRTRARELSFEINAVTRRRIPEIFPDPESVEEGRGAGEASIAEFAGFMEHGLEPVLSELVAPALVYAREAVRRGVPVAALLRSYRIGHMVVWKELLDELAWRTTSTEDFAEATGLYSM